MNKVYKLVWCATTQTWHCVSEIVRSRGKASRAGAASVGLALAFSLHAHAGGPAPNQLPAGGQVVAGQAQITANAPATLNIVQSTHRAAIDWQSFSIGAAAQVNFQQPSASSVTLNRVLGADPSQVFGSLTANGHVYLSNPNGVLFAPGARLDVGAIVATTMSISTDDFMAGRDSFSRNGSTAGVVNQGAITARAGGYVALLAPEVRNEGVIVAQAGTVAMAGGELVTLNFAPDSRLASITVTPAQIRTLVENRRAVLAEGGQVILSARSVDQLLASVINTGTLSASSIVERGGKISIEADSIALADSSHIEASGATGGGQVLIGGGWQGSGGQHQATRVTMAPGAVIDASATASGDGGTVVLWSDTHNPAGRTQAQGSISARGGAQGGRGGRVETSGATLAFDGLRVDTSAPRGATGLWLADPYDLVVDASAASTINTNLASTNVTLQTTATGSSGPGTPNASGSGDITINSALSWTSGNTLTLDAYRSININAAINAGNTGDVVLVTGDTAGTGVSGSATGDYSFGSTTAGGTGNLTFGTTASTASLLIAQGGSGAPSAYTLIYDTGTGANGFMQAGMIGSSGNYALANSIDGGTVTTAMVSSFGDSSTHVGSFTGLGNAVTGLTITASGANAGLFGTVYGTLRDIGVTGATMNLSSNISNYGLLAGTTSLATIKNSWSTGTVNMSAGGTNSNAGGLVGSMTGGTLSNSYSTADVTGRTGSIGGLAGLVSSGTVSNSYASGAVNNGTGGNFTGGLLGRLIGTASLVSSSHAGGNVTSLGSDTGGLIGSVAGGSVGSPNAVTSAYATGTVTGADQLGGLIGNADNHVNITSSYAIGNVTGTSNSIGGLVGVTGTWPVNITSSYATGALNSTAGSPGLMGGLIGVYRGGTIATSYATGRVSAVATLATSMGGLVGQVETGSASFLTDVYAQGAVSGNSYVGGLVGYSNTGSGLTIRNAYASGFVSTTGAGPTFIGGVQGNSHMTTVYNVFWDSSFSGTNQASGYGQAITQNGGGAVSTATLQNGIPAGTGGTAVPGFNGTNANGITPNGSPWSFTSGFKPYFSWQFPNGTQLISGTGYTSAGAGASAATIRLYANGGLLSGGMVSTNGTGAYTALLNAGSVTTSTKLGATFTLSGAGSISGASYTDAPTMSGADVTGFDLKQGLFLTTTADTTNSALQTSLASAFGSGTYSTLTSTLGSAWWQVNAGGNFTVDTALSHAGSTGLRASGNLAINAGVTATGSTLTLQATGNITENSSGAITATNLVLLGGAVALNSQGINAITSTNNVTTLAASGVSSLSYVDSDALTVGSVGPYQGGITAANINGTTTTTTGLSAAGSLSVYSAADVLTVASNISTTAGAPDATLTLRAGTNLIVNDGLSIGSGGTGKLHTVLWSGWASQGSRGGMSVGSTSFNTQGGLFWAGGSAFNDATPSTIRDGVTTGTGFAAQFQAGASRGASFIGTTITTGGGDLLLNGRYSRPAAGSDIAGLYLQDVTLNAAGGDINLRGQLQNSLTTGAAVHLSGNSSVQASGVGTITVLGTDTSTPTGSSHGILFSSNGSETTTLKTVSGAIDITGTSSASAVSDSAGVKFNLATPTTGHFNIVSSSGNITVSGTQSSGLATSGVEGINFSAIGSGSAGAIQIGAEGASAYTGALLIQGSSIAHTGTSTTAGLVALKGSGSMTLDSPGNSFVKPQTLGDFWDIGTNHSSLTVGKSTNTANVTSNAARTVAGPITIYGGDVSTSASLTSTAAAADIKLLATGSILASNTLTLTSNGGAVLLASDTDNSAGGRFNASGNLIIATSGGNITVGGGNTAGSGYATGTGSGNSSTTIAAGASFQDGVNFNSGGGNIAVRGKSFAGAPGTAPANTWGVGFWGGAANTINSGTGTVTIDGTSQVNAVDSFSQGVMSNGAMNITSANTTADAIKITGVGGPSDGSPDAQGVYITSGSSITATGAGGGITIQGTRNGDVSDVELRGGNILAVSGPIKILGTSSGGTVKFGFGANVVTLGKKAATGITASSSDITIQGDLFGGATVPVIDSTGHVLIQSASASFGAALNTSAFSMPGTGYASFTVGKTTNGADVTIGSAATVAGPISVYGGHVTVNSPLTNGGVADTRVLLKAEGHVFVNSNITSSANPVNVVLWSDSNGSGSGAQLLTGSTINTAGGHFWAGGGSGNTTWNGLTVGNASAITNSGGALGFGMTGGASVSTGVGDIRILGAAVVTTNTGTQFSAGINLDNASLASTSGDIELLGTMGGTFLTGAGLWFRPTAGQTASVTTTTGNLSVLGTGSDAAGTGNGWRHGVVFDPQASNAVVTLKTTSGSLNVEGNANYSNGATSEAVGLRIYMGVSGAKVNLVSQSGDVTLRGTSTMSAQTNQNALAFTTPDAANSLNIGYDGVSTYSGNIKLQANSIRQDVANAGAGSVRITSTDAVTIEPTGASFTRLNVGSASTLTFDNDWNFGTTIGGDASSTGLTFGKASNTFNLTLSNAITTAGTISATGDNLSVAALTTPGTINLTSTTGGTMVQTGALSADALKLAGGSATLTNTSNNVATLAASGMGSLSYIDSNALAIGTVGSTSGIGASSTISVATLTGDMTLSQNVTTTNTGTSAIHLNAGQSTAAGTASGGNLVVSGSPTVSTGAGGRATLYSGNATGDASLATLIGAGSGHFRYNSDETTSNFSTALGTGLYGIYREHINTAFSVGTVNTVYGTAPSLAGSSNLVNGDAASLAVSSPLFSSSSNYRVGSYGISISNLAALAALGYTTTGTTSGTLTVTPKALTVSGFTAANKVYDATTAATVSNTGAVYTGLVSGDMFTATLTGTFSDKHVANGKTVMLSSSYSGADIGNYAITDQASTTANITPKALTVSGLTVANRAYNGSAVATVLTGGVVYGGLIGGDSFSVSATGAFANKHVGNAKTVTISSSYSGADTGNYTITNQATTAADITAASLSIGTADVSKVYDGTTSTTGAAAVLLGGTQLFGGDTLFGGSFAYASKAVGAGNKSVTGSGFGVSDGNSGNNYSISYVTNTSSTITPKALTVSGLGVANREYDGSAVATVLSGGVQYSGLVAGDVISISASGLFADKHVGNNRTVALSSSYGGADAGNYAITDQATTTASITPKALTISGITAASKVYDGNAGATVNAAGIVYGGRVSGDDFSLVSSTGAFGNKNVGTGKTVTLSNSYSGTDAGNYTLTDQTSTTANITAKALTISGITADSKVYDGNTVATLNTGSIIYGGRVSGDDVTVSVGATGVFDSKHVGTGKAVTLSNSFSGADLNNYTITDQGSTTADVSAKALTVSGITAAHKVYDALTTATVSTTGAVYAGLVSGDAFSVNATGVFDSKNVGTGKTVTLTPSYVGGDVGNYTITGQASTTANISQKALTVSGIAVANRSYDGTAIASVDLSGINYAGKISGDAFTAAVTGSYADKHVGAAKPITLNSSYSGADVGNYAVTGQAGTTGDISAAAITIGTGNVSKVYDGTTTANAGMGASPIALSGTVFSGDSLSGGSLAYTGKNVGAGNKTVVVSGVSVNDGNGGANYAVTYANNTSSSITPRALTLSGLTVADRVYDGTAIATVDTSGAAYTGRVSGDAVFVSASGNFDNKNVGAAKPVTITSSYSGVDAGNYTITNQAGTTAEIFSQTLTISGLTVAGRVYDGTATATVNSAGIHYDGLVSGDAVTLDTLSGAFANKHAGTAKPVTISSSFTGSDLGNYTLVKQTSTTADITPATLKISTTDVTKVYDSTTTVFGGSAVATDGTSLVGGDTLTGGNFVYVDKNVGVGNKVVVTTSGVTVNDGNGGANYNASYVNNTNSTITPKGLTITGLSVNDRVYDGTATASVLTGAANYTGLIAGDDVIVAATGNFANKHVGTNKTVTLGSSYTGADVGNYTITDQATTTASITLRTLTLGGLTVADHVYNGSDLATVVTGGADLSGKVVGDNVALASSTGLFPDKHVGTARTVTLTNTFSGSDFSNYFLVDQASTTASITPYALTVSTPAVTKVYDGTTTTFGAVATAIGGTALQGSDTLSGGSFSYVSRNVGVNNKVVVNVSNATVNDGNSGNNYAVTYVNNTDSTITPKALTIAGLTAAHKVYDATTAATVGTGSASYTGLIGGDAVTVSATGTFADKNVANGKTVTLLSNYSGADVGNYTITGQASTTANITQRTLTIDGLSVADRSYDGSAVATVVTGGTQFTGLIAGDAVSLVSSTGVFGNKHVGNGKTVTLTNSYSGADLPNYGLSDQATTTASITPALLTLSTSNVSKTYDATTTATAGMGTGAIVTGGQLFGDSISGGSFAYADKNAGAGSKVVNVSGVTLNDGNSGANYTVSYAPNTTSTINQAALTISGITAANKAYDGKTTATVITAGAAYTGLIAGDLVTVSATGTFGDKNTGTGKTVTLASSYSGADVGNYAITSQPTTTADITAATLLVTANDDARYVATADNPAYNGVHYDGFVGGDSVADLNVSGLSVTRPNAGVDVGAGLYVGALVPSGVSAGNYTVSYANGDYRIIAASNALVKVLNSSITYSGTPVFTPDTVQYMDGSNVVSNLSFSSSSGNSYTYVDGAGGTLSFTLSPQGQVLSSASKLRVGNYDVADASPTIGGGNLAGAVLFTGNLAVMAKAVTANASGVTKVYDGTTAMTGVALNLTGQVSGDLLNVNGSGAFSQKGVGSNLNYSLSGITLAGTDAGNYYLSGGSTLSGSNGAITPATVTISGITAADRIYDQGIAATVNTGGAVYTGRIGSDDISVAATGLFGNKNAGVGKTVTLTSSYGGADAGNYSFVNQTTTTATISPKALTVSGLAVDNRVYDGTNLAAVNLGSVSYTGRISGDAVTVSATGTFANKHVDHDKLVTLASSYSGADVANYSITSQATTSGDITPAAIAIRSSDVSKTYDGTTTATGGMGAGAVLASGTLFSGDSISGGSFSYLNKHAGTNNRTVQTSGVTVTDGNGGANYSVSYLDNTTSTITPASLTLSGLAAVSRVYDGGTVAAVNTGGAVYTGRVSGDDVTVSATGAFANKHVGTGKTVLLTSNYGGADVGNYTITDQAASSANITQKTLTLSGLSVANRVYNGTDAATVISTGANYSGLVGGDAVSVSATGTFANKHVGMGKTVTLASSYTGADVGNYAITDQGSANADITQALITVTTGAVSKTYDGNTSVTGASALLSGGTLFTGDTLSGGSFAYTDKNAGAGNKQVLVSAVTISDGNSGSNYSVTYANNTASTITPKAMTVSGIAATSKVYDGSAADPLNTGGPLTYTGRVGSDDVALLSASGSFADKNVGTAKPVTITGTYGGADAGNYTISTQDSSADITQAPLTISGLGAANRLYNGSAVAVVLTGGVQYGGLIAGDSVSLASATGAFANKHVGAGKTVTLTNSYSGADLANYQLFDQATTTANITPAALTISSSDVTKQYNGTTDMAGATGQGAIVTSGALFGGDTLSGGTFAYLNKNVGSGAKPVSVSAVTVNDGNSGSNYSVSYANNTQSTITAAPLSYSGLTASNKVYDGNAVADVVTSGASFSGLFGGDAVTLLSASGSFASKHVGNGKTVTLTSNFGGADAGNYTITPQATTTANITLATLTVSGLTVADRVYDSSANAAVLTGAVQLTGYVAGDAFTISASGLFGDKHVGSNKAVTLSSSYGGADRNNYTVIDQAGTTASITPAALSLSGISAAGKVYDRTTSAVVSTASAVYGGLFSGDAVTVAATGTFASRQAGTGKTVNLVSSYAGADLGNYTITDQATATADITPKTLTLSGITAAGKVYDGNTQASVNAAGLVYGGLISGDDVTASVSAAGVFDNRNAGTGKTVEISSSYGGADLGNYSIVGQASTTADITPKALSVTGITAAHKVYDAGTAATVSTTGAVYTGLVSGDAFSVSATGQFNSKNVGTGKAVSLTSSYVGGDVGNYAITSQAATTANITQAALNVTGVTVSTRSYDGGIVAPIDLSGVHYDGLISGDSLTLSATGSFANRHAGTAKPVTLITGYSGSDFGNYSITTQSSATGDITRALITFSTSAVSKVYDSTTLANAGMGAAATIASGALFGSDSFSGGSFVFADRNVGSGNMIVHVSGVTLSDGNGGGNYALNYADNTISTITPKPLSVSGITASHKVYDGNLQAQVSIAGPITYNGLLGGDDVSLHGASGLYADKNVGSGKPVSLSSSYAGNDVGNYTITSQATTTAGITPAALVLSNLTVASRSYDGSAIATIVTGNAQYTGRVAGDDVSVSASGLFNNRHAGSNKPVAISSSYSGADVGNYTITSQAGTSASITPAPLTVGAANVTKTYDGSTSVDTGNGGGQLFVTGGTQLFGGDTLNAGTLLYASKQAGQGNKVVQLSGVSVSDGNGGGNYALTLQDNTSSTIAQAPLALSGITAANKTYDASTAATLDSSGLGYTGLIGSDAVTATFSGVFNNKNAGTGKTVFLTGAFGGADAGNYLITAQPTTTADITPLMLSIGGFNNSGLGKTYDGSLLVPLDLSGISYGGLLPGDSIGLQAVGLLGDKNVGVNKPVTINSSLTGLDAGNYTFSLPTSGTATLTRAPLAVSGLGAGSKTYDGTTNVGIDTSGVQFTGLVGGDAITVNATGQAADRHAGVNKAVAITSVYGGADLGNYAITDQAGARVTIDRAPLTVSIGDVSKVYDGTTSGGIAALTLTGGSLFAGDTLDSGSYAFADRNAGANKTVIVSGAGITDGNGGGNYAISYAPNTTSAIAPKPITVSGAVAQDKFYDTHTAAQIRGAALTPGDALAGDDLALASADSGNFADADVGNDKPVSTGMTLSGADAGNYRLQQPGGLRAKILPPPITVLEPPPPPIPEPPAPPSDNTTLGGAPALPPALPPPPNNTGPTPGTGLGNGGGGQQPVDQKQPIEPGPDGGAISNQPDDKVPGIKALILLHAMAEARNDGGDFISVLSFEPVRMQPGGTVAVALPLSTFAHSDPVAVLIYEATLADGTPLPPWLNFDPEQLRFSGTAPADVQILDVTVTARDRAGHTARSSVTIQVQH